MPYPFGAQTATALPDLPTTLLQRRQGDVKATLIPITLNGQAINIAGFTFHFSVTLPGGVQDVIWTIQAPTNSNPITTIDGTGFIVPPYNASVVVTFASTATFNVGEALYIPGAGIMTIQTVSNSITATLLNSGLSGNASSGTINPATPVYEVGQVGMTVLIIPSVITISPVGLYPFFLKYDTTDPFPGPYKVTFLQGSLQILEQNNPNV
jgi:hypothetical protein